METGLLHLHNFLRWVILILLLWSLVKAYTGWKAGKAFDAKDKKTWLFTMIAAHTTLLLGLYQVGFGRYGIFSTSLPEGVSFMKDKFYRFFWMEHPVTMMAAIVFITLAHRQAKTAQADTDKYRKATYFFALALLLLLAGIPWPFREIIGRPLFPGM